MPLLPVLHRSIVAKTAFLVLVVVILLVTALVLTSRTLVLDRFTDLEQKEARVQVQRVVNEINATLEKLQAFATDWSYWDDTFQFLADRNDAYIDNNLMDETFIDQRLNLIYFVDNQGQTVHSQFFDLVMAKPIEPNPAVIPAIKSLTPPVRTNSEPQETVAGLLVTPTGPLLVISSPVLPSLRNQPSRGRLVVGRYLDDSEVTRIAHLMQVQVAVHPLALSTLPSDQIGPDRFEIEHLDAESLRAATVLADVAGQPALRVSVTLPRTMFRQGYAMWQQHVLSAALLGGVFVVVLVMLLHRLVLRKLIRLSREIDRIREEGDPGQTVTVSGEDEIGSLAGKLNALLVTLRQLQDNREQRQRYLQRMLDTINCGVLVITAEERRIVAVNRRGAAMLGRQPEEMVGQGCRGLICPRERDDCPVPDNGEGVNQREAILLGSDGRELPVLKSVAAIEHEGRHLLVESFVDISPLKQAEAELRASEIRYRRFFDDDLTGNFIVTAGGQVVDGNPAFARMLGYESIDQAMGEDLPSRYAKGEDWRQVVELIRRDGKIERHEVELRRRDGSPLYCIGNQIGTFDHQGNLTEIRGYLFDDTKRVQLEREIRHNQKLEAIGTLAGGIAHDFNNILAGIIGYAEIILLKEAPDSRVQDYLKKILAAGEKARELIYQILAFSRKTETSQQSVRMTPVIHEVMQMLRATLPTTIAIEERLQDDLNVMADPVQIHQIILNLCTNAGHAMRKHGGTLTVELERFTPDSQWFARNPTLTPGDYVHLQVSDTGHGIAEEIRNRIFDPFFTTKGKDEGTGLGLSVIHGIVQTLKGVITVASTPGVGTRFEIFLPCTETVAPDLPAEQGVRTAAGEHIVYVDDEPFLTEIGKEILHELGYKVTDFTDSTMALDFLSAHRGDVDLVISDLTMPGMTGIGLARALREAGIAIPLIICTGYQDDLAGENLDLLGVSKVLLKPINVQILAHSVGEVLDQHHQGKHEG